MQLLCDAVLSAPSASFHTPFKQLGISPEGCSTVTFERKIGSEGARRMLAEGEKLSATTAAELGFVDVLVESEGEGDLVATACAFAERWVAEGKGRAIVEHGLVDELDRVNQREGQQLADAMFSKAFWAANLRKALGWKSK
jgi:enoyl-CoA hydratase/carnithine racemase